MVATDLGVYILNNGSSIWSAYSQGLPNVIVSDIEFNPASNKIYISTFGRGIWETNLNLVSGIDKQGNPQLLDFTVFPSVNKGRFTLELADWNLKTELQIFDVSGRCVYSAQLKEATTELSLQVLPGTYYVRAENEKSMGVRKVIVE